MRSPADAVSQYSRWPLANAGQVQARSGLRRHAIILTIAIMAVALGSFEARAAGGFAQPLLWPLCGRLGEAPDDWQPGDPCPRRFEVVDDLPIHNGFGYRTYVSDVRPVSFHRGVDLATRSATKDHGFVGNPTFAVCDGYVYRISGSDPDATLELKCPESTLALQQHGDEACTFSPCITAAYRHVRNLLVQEGSVLSRGDHIGYTGETAPLGDVFEHLHFEILDPRERPSNTNGGRTAFSKDAHNPLRYFAVAQPGIGLAEDAIVPSVNLSSPLYGHADGNVSLVIDLAAGPSFQHNFVSAEAALYVRSPGPHDAWLRLPKAPGAVDDVVHPLSIPGEFNEYLSTWYEVGDGSLGRARFDPERWCGQFTPYSDTSSLWEHERTMTYFRELLGGEYDEVQGVDALVERHSGASLPNGHRIAELDLHLIAPWANPDVSVDSTPPPSTWWGFSWGLRGYELDLDAPFCVDLSVTVLLLDGTGATSTARYSLAGNEATEGCPAAGTFDDLLRDGFEP